MSTTIRAASHHLEQLRTSLRALDDQLPAIERWGRDLCRVFERGGKLMAVGNGGSAALAAHLTGELVGRYVDERQPFPAIWIGADQSATTAIINDYGHDEVFGRQIAAHARDGDVVVLMTTSGRSRNIVAAAEAARLAGAWCWGLTGPTPNPVADLCQRVLTAPGPTPVVQEVQQVQVHLLCEALDAEVVHRAAGRRRVAEILS